ncbi:MAG TPA: TonB family protein [Terriglobales bacterium]|nr:TonB family protein [Terriglobales bacterium]
MSQPPGRPNPLFRSETEAEPGLEFLPRLEPRISGFLGNARALWERTADENTPSAPFWTDVFIATGLPWRSLAESGLSHILLVAAMVSLTHAWLNRPRVILQKPFQRSQIVYYTTSEYLPEIKTPTPRGRTERPAEPAQAAQEIIAVPAEADNRRQTIITPPDVKLAQEMALPNLVAWTRDPGPVPVPASLNSRLSLPAMAEAAVPPAPEVTQRTQRAAVTLPQTAVVPPPPEIAQANKRGMMRLPAATVIGPPPEITRSNEHAALMLPQPQAVAPAPYTASLSAAGHGPQSPTPSVIPPPPGTTAVATSSSAPSLAGIEPRAVLSAPETNDVAAARPSGQMIALSLSPSAVHGPIEIPQGNRRGMFAAGPSGNSAASGMPAANSGGPAEAGTGTADRNHDQLAGINVEPGPAPVTKAAMPVVAAAPARNLWAMASIPAALRNMPARVSRTLPSAPSAIDRQVFGHKKFYSVTLNMPNLNSRSGSWVIRFAELNEDRQEGELTAPVVVDKVDPAYPGILMREHITGTVTLYAVIGADGSVGDVHVLSGVDNRLDAAARDALRHCHFRPATKNGQAVALEAVIRIPFEVHRIPY